MVCACIFLAYDKMLTMAHEIHHSVVTFVSLKSKTVFFYLQVHLFSFNYRIILQ